MTTEPKTKLEHNEIIANLKKQLADANKRINQLTQQNQAFNEMLHLIPHDFRGHLSMIQGYSHLLLEDGINEGQSLSEFQTESIEYISTKTQRLAHLIYLLVNWHIGLNAIFSDYEEKDIHLPDLLKGLDFQIKDENLNSIIISGNSNEIITAIHILCNFPSSQSQTRSSAIAIEGSNVLFKLGFLKRFESIFHADPETNELVCNNNSLSDLQFLAASLIKRQGGAIFIDNQNETKTTLIIQLPIASK